MRETIEMVDPNKKDCNIVYLDKSDTSSQVQNSDVKLSNVQQRKQIYEEVPVPLDGGYGWVVVAAVAYCLFCAVSGLMVFGIFLVEFLEHFNVSKSYVSWIGSLQMLIAVPTGILTPTLVKKLGCRPLMMLAALGLCVANILNSLAPSIPFLFFSIGILTGTTGCMVYITSQVPVQQYFHKKRTFASSIVVLGSGSAMFIWPPLSRLLIDTFGWRGAYIMVGGICLNAMVPGALLRPPPMKMVLKEIPVDESHNKTLSTEAKGSPSRCIKYLPHVLMFLGWFGSSSGQVVIVTFTPLRAKVLGFTKTQGALLLSIIGGISCVLRVLVGWYGDRSPISRLTLLGIAVVFSGVITTISLLMSTFPLLISYALLYGFGLAAFMGLQGATVYDVVGLKHIESGFTILSTAFGIGSFYSLPLAGLLYDLTGHPMATVLLFGIIQTLGGICFLFIPCVQRYLEKRENIDKLR